jgi:hypothetical protein
MKRVQSLSYSEEGILWLDEWNQAETEEEEAAIGEGVDSRPLGHINNPRTGFNVPEGLHAEWDELLAEWANDLAIRLRGPRQCRMSPPL